MDTTNTTTPADDSNSVTLQLIIAQQAAALVEMQRAMTLLAERVEASVGTARGAGDRITLSKLRDKAVAAMTTNTKRTYEGYMNLLVDGDPSLMGSDGRAWVGMGAMWADEVLPSHLEVALGVVATRAQRRAEDRAAGREAAERTVRSTDGHGARYNAIGAWRRLFEAAINDRHLAEGMNPAQKLKKPPRAKGGSRDALEDEHFSAMVQLLGSTGDDPELDGMIVRFLDITGARQEGVINLSPSAPFVCTRSSRARSTSLCPTRSSPNCLSSRSGVGRRTGLTRCSVSAWAADASRTSRGAGSTTCLAIVFSRRSSGRTAFRSRRTRCVTTRSRGSSATLVRRCRRPSRGTARAT